MNAIAALAFLPGPAKAQIDPAFVKAQTGPWMLTAAGKPTGCVLTFTDAPSIAGYELKVGPGCAKAFPVLGEVGVWNFGEDADLLFLDGLRQVKVRFLEQEDATYETRPAEGPVWSLKPKP